MKAIIRATLAVTALAGCTTVSLSRLDRCMVRRTSTLVSAREDVLFCDEDAPAWSNDRAVRLTQECLYQQRQTNRETMLTAVRSDVPIPKPAEENGVSQCLPEALQTVQLENEALKDRVTREGTNRRQMEQRHVELENGLTRALDRPINAVADARATSDSGSNARENHQSTVSAEPGAKHVVLVTPAEPTKPATGRHVMKKAIAEEKRSTCPACLPGAPASTPPP